MLGAPALDLAQPATPLSGGFDTSIYAIRLQNAPAAFSRPLILRVLAPRGDPAARVLRERATQNAVAAQGYPAPRVLATTTDAAPLGAPFLVMERLPGTVLVDAQRLGMMRTLLAALPDGTADFEDFCDGDGVLENGDKDDQPFWIRMRVDKRGDRLIVDFAGTDRQVAGPMRYGSRVRPSATT